MTITTAQDALKQLRSVFPEVLSQSLPPGFIVRVELLEMRDVPRDESTVAYKTLHLAMASFGLHRVVTITGTDYRLPDATYYKTAGSTNQQILAEVQQAVKPTGRKYSVAIANATEVTVSGLELAIEEARST